MTALQRFDYFFDLPGELRKQVLRYLLVKPGGIIIGEPGVWSQIIAKELGQPQKLGRRTLAGGSHSSSSSSSSSEDEDDDDDDDLSSSGDDYDDQPSGRRRRRKSRWPINYFLVSQTFHREGTAVYFRENTFYLLATGRKSPHDGVRPTTAASTPSAGLNRNQNHQHYYHHHRNNYDDNDRRGGRRQLRRKGGGGRGVLPGTCEELLGETRYRDSRRRMRKVVLYVKALRGPLVEAILKPLGDMVLAGGLKHLEIRVWWFQAKGRGMLSSVPMQAMYRVLKDPDLESARLKVLAGYHERSWCPFHACRSRYGLDPIVCDGGLAKGEGPSLSGEEDGGEGQGGLKWLEIDLEGLIRQYGEVEEALRILKVGD